MRFMTAKALCLGAALFVVSGAAMAAVPVLPPLDQKQTDIVRISSYTAAGDLVGLEDALRTALAQGMTVNEIKEILVQLYAYCGFPRSLNAINTFIRVYDQTENPNMGVEGKALFDRTNKNSYGAKVQTGLIGKPAEGRYIEFAPAIDTFLKEHLFADIFARGVLTHQEREIATIAALATLPGVAPQLASHISMGKNTGLKDEQINEILKLTGTTFGGGPFGVGPENSEFAQFFVGKSYRKQLTSEGLKSSNITFEPGCRNNWHIHHKSGQILYVVNGRGYYQEWGKDPIELRPGAVVNIPPEVKHWHGAAKDSWFSHISVEVPAEGASNEWLEPVAEADYQKLR